MEPAATVSAARLSAWLRRRSSAGCLLNGGVSVPFAARRISNPMKAATAKSMKIKKRSKKEVSTVRMQEASMAVKASMARNKASRSVVALYNRTSITKIRKWIAASRAASSAGLVELATNAREKNKMSRGKKPRYATTSQVAVACDNSAGWPRHRRTPLYRSASGASTQASRSSLPVLTNVAMEVRIRKKREARKKRSAGRVGSFAGIVAVAAMSLKFHGSTRRVSCGEWGRTAVQKITRQHIA